MVSKDKLESFVTGWFFARLADAGVAQARARRTGNRTRDAKETRLLEALDAARTERDTLIASQDTAQYKGAMVAVLLEMINKAQSRVDELEKQLDQCQIAQLTTPDGPSLAEQWPQMDLDQRRYMLRRLIRRIEVQPGNGSMEDRVTIISIDD